MFGKITKVKNLKKKSSKIKGVHTHLRKLTAEDKNEINNLNGVKL